MADKFERFGNYILLDRLNAGGMAEVFLAKSIGASGVNKFVAIKRILPQFSDNKEFIDMFKSEAKIAVNLHHSNVVSIIDFKAEKGQLYLVMEFLQGQNLRQLLQQKKKAKIDLSLPFIVYVAREVAAGLDHAHRCIDKTSNKPLDIIHRDMSPQNIMISYDGEVKIVDFGIAKSETALENTRAGTLKGKFSYMSPEQAEGDPANIDQSTDIFSLGIILWELIADDRLFVANNELNILKRIKECDIPDLRKYVPTVPFELERIVKKALAKDKHLRYQTAADLQKDLTRFLNREYPDFTPNDFATYVKYLFENEFKQMQNRLVELSRVTMENLGGPEKLEITNTFTGRHTKTYTGEAPEGVAPQLSFRKSDEPSVVQNPGKSGVLKNNDSIERTATNFRRRDPVENSYSRGSTSSTNSRPSRTSRDSGNDSGFKVSYFTVAIFSIITLVVGAKILKPDQPIPCTLKIYCEGKIDIRSTSPVALKLRPFDSNLNPISIAGANIYINRKLQKLNPDGTINVEQNADIMVQIVLEGYQPFAKKLRTASTNIQTEDVVLTQKVSVAETGSNPLAIYAGDVRARIYINNTDTGQFTPANVMVNLNRTIKITLTAENYCPQSLQVTPTGPAQTVQLKLAKCPTAYLNLKAVQVGTSPRIYIDNLLVGEKLPLVNFPVPANRQVEIRLEDEYRGKDKKVITLREHEKRDITLIPTFSK